MNKSEIYEHANKVLLLLKFSKGAKSRKIILKSLCLKPKNCNQIAKESKLEWWTVQKHLEVLMKENLIISVRFGRIKFYKITPKGEKTLTEIFSSQKPTSQS